MVMHAVFFSIWSGSLRWLLLFTQTRVQTLHLRRSNITGLLQKAFFFEGGGLDRDKRIQSVRLGHFLFTPSCCSHNRCIEMSRLTRVFCCSLFFFLFCTCGRSVRMVPKMQKINSQTWHPEWTIFYPSHTDIRDQVWKKNRIDDYAHFVRVSVSKWAV